MHTCRRPSTFRLLQGVNAYLSRKRLRELMHTCQRFSDSFRQTQGANAYLSRLGLKERMHTCRRFNYSFRMIQALGVTPPDRLPLVAELFLEHLNGVSALLQQSSVAWIAFLTIRSAPSSVAMPGLLQISTHVERNKVFASEKKLLQGDTLVDAASADHDY